MERWFRVDVNEYWPALVRKYLAFREPQVLEQAINAARNKEVFTVLRAFQQHDIATVDRLARPLFTQLHQAGLVEEALTIGLVDLDTETQLVELHVGFPTDEQGDALRRGFEGCNAAMHLAWQLRDLPCFAFYLRVRAQGLFHARDLKEAGAWRRTVRWPSHRGTARRSVMRVVQRPSALG